MRVPAWAPLSAHARASASRAHRPVRLRRAIANVQRRAGRRLGQVRGCVCARAQPRRQRAAEQSIGIAGRAGARSASDIRCTYVLGTRGHVSGRVSRWPDDSAPVRAQPACAPTYPWRDGRRFGVPFGGLPIAIVLRRPFQRRVLRAPDEEEQAERVAVGACARVCGCPCGHAPCEASMAAPSPSAAPPRFSAPQSEVGTITMFIGHAPMRPGASAASGLCGRPPAERDLVTKRKPRPATPGCQRTTAQAACVPPRRAPECRGSND